MNTNTNTRGKTMIMTPEETDAVLYRFAGVPSLTEWDRLSVSPFPYLPVQLAAQIIDGEIGDTNFAAMHAKWVQEDRQQRPVGGRRATVSTRSIMIITLMHWIAGESASIRHMARTMEARLTDEQKRLIGVDHINADGTSWYNRITSATKTMHEVMDSEPMPKYSRKESKRLLAQDKISRHRKLTGEQRVELHSYRQSIRAVRAVRRERLEDFTFALVSSIVTQAKAINLLDGYNGDVALDGTYVRVDGTASNQELNTPARSTNLEAGVYARRGNHRPRRDKDPSAKPKSKLRQRFGFEADIVTMTSGTPSIPNLVLGATLHRPGMIRGVASTLFPRINDLYLPAGNISVDRAYNALKTHHFHEVLMQFGYEFVFDYKRKNLGEQASFHHEGVGYIMVEGTWYLASLPSQLADAVIHSQLPETDDNYIDKETLLKRIEARRDYQLVRHGRRDRQGFQRYKLPDSSKYIAFDQVTGELLPKPTVKTVTIPATVGLKFAQKYPYKTPEWQAAYNLRSEIERKNGQLKHSRFEGLGDALRRPGRGYTAHAIALAMSLVAHNIRTIDVFVRKAEGIDTTKSASRRSRRDTAETLTDIRPQRDGRAAA